MEYFKNLCFFRFFLNILERIFKISYNIIGVCYDFQSRHAVCSYETYALLNGNTHTTYKLELPVQTVSALLNSNTVSGSEIDALLKTAVKEQNAYTNRYPAITRCTIDNGMLVIYFDEKYFNKK